jgi:cytochrome c oxidase subunit 2
MIFYVVADPPAEFQHWLDHEAQDEPLVDPDGFEGRQVFLEETCAGCHTVRGTKADGTLGPDLTHLAGRDTIASGALTNTRANLARWILHPQSVKPGTMMPPTSLEPRELDAVLDFLEQLR